jgi:hypothetical protein
MRLDFDIFEKFLDGSTLWRACIKGHFETKRKMYEFVVIDVQAEESLPLIRTEEQRDSRPLAKSAAHS